MMLSGLAALTLFPLLMAYAAFSDLFTMTISNKVSLVLVAAFVPFAALAHMSVGDILLLHLLPGLAVLGLTIVFFARGWIGGGDAKLAAATAVWLGWENLGAYGLQASVLGAGLTIAILLARKQPLAPMLREHTWIARLHQAGTGVPYGIALAVAGLLTYPDTAMWRALLQG